MKPSRLKIHMETQWQACNAHAEKDGQDSNKMENASTAQILILSALHVLLMLTINLFVSAVRVNTSCPQVMDSNASWRLLDALLIFMTNPEKLSLLILKCKLMLMDGMCVSLVNLDSSGKMVMQQIKETVSSVKRKYQDATDAKMESSVINA